MKWMNIWLIPWIFWIFTNCTTSYWLCLIRLKMTITTNAKKENKFQKHMIGFNYEKVAGMVESIPYPPPSTHNSGNPHCWFWSCKLTLLHLPSLCALIWIVYEEPVVMQRLEEWKVVSECYLKMESYDWLLVFRKLCQF